MHGDTQIPTGEKKWLKTPDFELTLPWPPSVNMIWRHVVVRGRSVTLLSAKGREYFGKAEAGVFMQRLGRAIVGRVAVEITLHPPDRRAIDIDNRVKATIDACTKGGLWLDDNQIDVLIVARGEIVRGGKAIVRASMIEG